MKILCEGNRRGVVGDLYNAPTNSKQTPSKTKTYGCGTKPASETSPTNPFINPSEMTMKFKLQHIAAAVTLLSGIAANATPFYLDVGNNYDPAGIDKACATCTSVKTEFNIRYESSTTIDALGKTSTTAGLALAGFNSTALSKNRLTALTPSQVFGDFSNNGFNTNYQLSFGITGLTGQVTGTYGSGLPEISYDAGGIIDFYITFNGTTFINFMDIKITGGQSDGNGTGITGVVDFTNVDSLVYANLFHVADGTSCNGSTGYYDIVKNCSPEMTISLDAHFDTTTAVAAPGRVTGIHDGSGTFEVSNTVPEPGSLALLGLGLAGIAGLSRRKSAAK